METIKKKLERMNKTIEQAIEFSELVRFHYFQYHQIFVITASIHFYDPHQQQLRVVDEDGQIHLLDIKQIFDVERID